MIKVVGLIRRNPALSVEAFRDYWIKIHVPLIKTRLPGLVHYSGSFPVRVEGTVGGQPQSEYDAIVELGFPDLATMEAQMNGPAFMAEDRLKSSATLMDLANTRSMVVEEIVVPLKQRQ